MQQPYQFIEIHGGDEDGKMVRCHEVNSIDLDEVNSISDADSGNTYQVEKIECGVLHMRLVSQK